MSKIKDTKSVIFNNLLGFSLFDLNLVFRSKLNEPQRKSHDRAARLDSRRSCCSDCEFGSVNEGPNSTSAMFLQHWTHSDTSSAAGWCHAFTAGEETSSIIWIICSNTPQSDAHLLKSGAHTWWCRDRWRETTPDLTRLDRDFSDFMSCFLHCWRVWLSPQVLLPSAVWGRKVSTWKWFSFKAAEQEFRADDCARWNCKESINLCWVLWLSDISIWIRTLFWLCCVKRVVCTLTVDGEGQPSVTTASAAVNLNQLAACFSLSVQVLPPSALERTAESYNMCSS